MSDPSHEPPPPRQKTTPWHAWKAVAWSFLGVRKGSHYREDLSRVNPLHVIVAGIVGAVLLVLGLLALVHWVAK